MENKDSTKHILKALVAVIVGAMVVTLALLISISFKFGIVGNLVTSWILTTAYAIFAFFLIEPTIKVNPTRFIDRPVVQEVIREVPVEVERIVEIEKLVPIQIPMENKTIEVVEKPVYYETIKEVQVEVPVEVEKRVTRYIERKHKKLNIPHFDYIGSTQTKTYHKRTCKFSKMLKNKYKLHSNSKAFFKRKHYHACEACINKK
jgi:hypothetical protein